MRRIIIKISRPYLQGVDNGRVIVHRLPHDTLPEALPVKIVLADRHSVGRPVVAAAPAIATLRPEEGSGLVVMHRTRVPM